MAFTNEEQTKMAATASGPAEMSLSEMLQQQYNSAYGKQQAQEAYLPTAQENIKAVGDFTDRAPGEAPVDISQQGLTLRDQVGQAVSGTQKSVLDVISQMMTLKKEEAAAEQRAFDRDMAIKDYNLKLVDKNMIIDPETGEPRGMTPEEMEELKLDGVDNTTKAWITEIEKGNVPKLNAIPSEERSKVIEALAKMDLTFDSVVRKQQGKSLEATLEPLISAFLGGTEKGDELASGRFGGLWRKAKAFAGKDSDVKVYQDLKEGLLGRIKAFTGDNGVMTDVDAARIEKNMPDVTETYDEAIKKMKIVNEIFSKNYGFDLIDPANFDGLEGDGDKKPDGFDSLWGDK